MASVTSYGAAQTVTGSCHLLKINSINILIDCGMFQGSGGDEKNYEPFEFDVSKIDYLVITHAHLDHIGRVPKLIKEGFRGKIIATEPTYDIMRIMLLDSAKLLKEEYKTLRRKARRRGEEDTIREPLYTEDHVKEIFEKRWILLDYFQRHKLPKHIHITLANAGHIMGSAFVMIDYEEKNSKRRVVFSGDIGSKDRLIIDSLDNTQEGDTLFIESTYGDRVHKPIKESIQEFKQTVVSTLERGGNVLIPSFALERTQEVLWLLHQMYNKGELPECQVFLDSPLAIKATKLYRKYPIYLSDTLEYESFEDSDPFSFDWLQKTPKKEQSLAINNVKKRAIIIAGSGMCNGGRIMHHLKHRLWNSLNTVMFVGYQVRGTLGRSIVDGERYVKIYGEDIVVKAEVVTINGFSAHGDQNDIMEWISHFRELKKIYLIHGEIEKMDIFSNAIKDTLDYEPIIVEHAKKIEL